MQVGGSNPLVVRRGVVFGEVITFVGASRGPVEMVLALADAILEPVEAHVDGFGTALLDCVREDAMGHSVVCFEWCGGLGMA